MLVLWELVSFRLEIVLVSVQDRCMVCAKCTIGLDIIFNAPVMRLNWKLISVRVEIVLILTQDRSMVCAGRTIGLDTILDAPDRTPRRRG